MEKGEVSAKFFKSFASMSKPVVNVMCMRDGTVLENLKAIHMGGVEFFSQFLQAWQNWVLPNLSSLVDFDDTEQ